ncbi:hypothetical protein BDZ89DRAFT_1075979 [Hymenopellis radicata]|nr:hypothetical protein BDZ89DRAFT_1075979 [Hymenopellis radicata]
MAFKLLPAVVLLATSALVNAAAFGTRGTDVQVCPWRSVLDECSCKCKQSGGDWAYVDYTHGCGATSKDGWCQTWCKPTQSSTPSSKQKWKELHPDRPDTGKEQRAEHPEPGATNKEKRKVHYLALDDDDIMPLCGGGLDMCPLSNFGYECVSFRHDAQNCGRCGNACGADEGVKGLCVDWAGVKVIHVNRVMNCITMSACESEARMGLSIDSS